jgi:hypothetical protein
MFLDDLLNGSRKQAETRRATTLSGRWTVGNILCRDGIH